MTDHRISVGLQLTRKGKGARKAPSIQSERYVIGKDGPLLLDEILWHVCRYTADFYLAAIPEEEVSNDAATEALRRFADVIFAWTVGGDKKEGGDAEG